MSPNIYEIFPTSKGSCFEKTKLGILIEFYF